MAAYKLFEYQLHDCYPYTLTERYVDFYLLMKRARELNTELKGQATGFFPVGGTDADTDSYVYLVQDFLHDYMPDRYYFNELHKGYDKYAYALLDLCLHKIADPEFLRRLRDHLEVPMDFNLAEYRCIEDAITCYIRDNTASNHQTDAEFFANLNYHNYGYALTIANLARIWCRVPGYRVSDLEVISNEQIMSQKAAWGALNSLSSEDRAILESAGNTHQKAVADAEARKSMVASNLRSLLDELDSLARP